jgi:hypothetical protein
MPCCNSCLHFQNCCSSKDPDGDVVRDRQTVPCSSVTKAPTTASADLVHKTSKHVRWQDLQSVSADGTDEDSDDDDETDSTDSEVEYRKSVPTITFRHTQSNCEVSVQGIFLLV